MSEIIEQKRLTPNARKKMSYSNTWIYGATPFFDFKDFAPDEMNDLNDGLGGKLSLKEAHILMWRKEPRIFAEHNSVIRYATSFYEMNLTKEKCVALGLEIVYKVEDFDFNKPNQIFIQTTFPTKIYNLLLFH